MAGKQRRQKINQITIIGGGSAGWIMALYLVTKLNRVNKKNVKITLIESPRIPHIGVGEGTITGFSHLLKELDVPEHEFMIASDATFKCAGRFVGWNLNKQGKSTSFLNPFIGGGDLEGFPSYHHYKRFGGEGRSYVDTTQPTERIVLNARSPKIIGDQPYEQRTPYTYHLNAAAFSEQLASIAKKRGVKYIQDELEDVTLDENGYISSLQFEKKKNYPVQFVVDCTGFRSRILQQALGEPFIPAGDSLLVDKAIPCPVPHEDPDKILPCTTARAMDGGWMFEVPLYSRLGTGYIYSSQFKTDDQAWDELSAKLGDRVPKDFNPKVIPMKIGRVKNTWVKNCVGAGLSAGFIEPLEATALYTIERTARAVVDYFPEYGVDDRAVKQFNKTLNSMYEQLLEYVVMIYYTSNRPEPFWLASRNDIKVPDSLIEKLELWKHYLPNINDVDNRFFFTHWSYYFMLEGKGFFDRNDYPGGGMLSWPAWKEHLAEGHRLFSKVPGALPSHKEYLDALHEYGRSQK